MITLITVYSIWGLSVIFGGLIEAENNFKLNRTFWAYMIILVILVIILSGTYGSLSLIGFLSMTTMFPLFYSIKYWKLNKKYGTHPSGWKTKFPLSKSQTIDWKTKLVLAILLNGLLTGVMTTL